MLPNSIRVRAFISACRNWKKRYEPVISGKRPFITLFDFHCFEKQISLNYWDIDIYTHTHVYIY